MTIAGGGIGRRLGDLDQFLVARQFARQQRVGEHFLAARPTAPPRLALQLVGIDLVDRRQPQDQLHGQRPLVALDQVEIGRRDAEPLGHRRLGQALAVADAADARPGEDLLFSHLSLTKLYRPAAIRRAFTILTTLQDPICQSQHMITLIFQQPTANSSLHFALQCK